MLDVAAVRAFVARLSGCTGPVGTDPQADAERIDLIRALDDLTNAAAGAQVALTEDFDASQCSQQRAAGTRAERVGQGVAAQVALARRTSPHHGRRHLSLARVLRPELPATYAALRAGRISERTAVLMAQGTACLSREHRAEVDADIAGDPDRIERLGERGVQSETAKAACRLDPASVVERRRRAESERHVTLRPAPGTMTYLTALLPVADGVAMYASLTHAADSARSTGTPKMRGQVMADTLRDRILGDAATSDPHGAPAGTTVVLNVIMTEQQLFGSDTTSEGEALVGGPAGGLAHIDADLARQLAALTPADRVRLRRLYLEPTGNELVAIDSRQRHFPAGLQRREGGRGLELPAGPRRSCRRRRGTEAHYRDDHPHRSHLQHLAARSPGPRTRTTATDSPPLEHAARGRDDRVRPRPPTDRGMTCASAHRGASRRARVSV